MVVTGCGDAGGADGVCICEGNDGGEIYIFATHSDAFRSRECVAVIGI